MLAIAILLSCQLVTAIPTDGIRRRYDPTHQILPTGQRNGRLQTPDEFIRELFPLSDIDLVWKAITGDGKPEQKQKPSNGDELRSMKLQTLENTGLDRQILNEQVRGIMCGIPRPVIIDAYKEMGIARGMTFRLYPECIRVNRCRNSGCCADGFVCKANQTDLVKTRLLVFDANANQPALHSISRSVVNHVSCSCVAQFTCASTLSCPSTHVWNAEMCTCECAKKCLAPYIQDHSTCLCKCKSGDTQCSKISKGLTKLPKEQCGTLEGSSMSLPHCDQGKTFYVACCRCMKRPCEKATMQKLRSMPSNATPVAGDVLNNNDLSYSFSFSASIIPQIGDSSFGPNKKYKYKISRHQGEEPSSDNSSED